MAKHSCPLPNDCENSQSDNCIDLPYIGVWIIQSCLLDQLTSPTFGSYLAPPHPGTGAVPIGKPSKLYPLFFSHFAFLPPRVVFNVPSIDVHGKFRQILFILLRLDIFCLFFFCFRSWGSFSHFGKEKREKERKTHKTKKQHYGLSYYNAICVHCPWMRHSTYQYTVLYTTRFVLRWRCRYQPRSMAHYASLKPCTCWTPPSVRFFVIYSMPPIQKQVPLM